MSKTDLEAINFVNAGVKFADETFSLTEVKKYTSAVMEFFGKKFASKDDSTSDFDILEEFVKMNDDLIISFPTFVNKEAIVLKTYDELIANFKKAIQIFLETKDKTDFYNHKTRTFDYDPKVNFVEATKQVFATISNDNPGLDIEQIIRENPSKFEKFFFKCCKYLKRTISDEFKERLIDSIGAYISYIDYLGGLTDMFSKQNDIYYRSRNNQSEDLINSGLSCLSVPKDEISSLYSRENLKDCSLLQLDGLLSFIINRAQKMQSSIGNGLFFAKLVGKDESKLKNEGELKTLWRKKMVFGLISKEIYEKGSTEENEVVAQNGATYYVLDDDFIDKIINKYEKAYSLFFPGSSIQDDYLAYRDSIGVGEAGKYFGKDNLIESLIIYSDESKINWGYTDEGKQGNSRYILLSFDIPGLNMPVRLHMEKDKLCRLALKINKDDEIPVYCGNEDFHLFENVVGTQALYLLDQKRINQLKSVIKRGDISSSYKDFGEHLNLIQVENSRKRIHKWKYGRKEIPDYYNVVTGEVRKTSILPTKPI